MTENTRERILKRLRSAVSDRQELPAVPPALQTPPLSRDEKLERLKTLMTAMRAEVHVVPKESWTDRLKEILRAKELKQMLYAPGTPVGDAVKAAWAGGDEGLPALRAYDAAVETFKDELFTMDAGITGTVGGIAETGALILWPDEKEPRLMSLVPGVHIAVLDAGRIYETFAEALEEGDWVNQMPANALLISGPSKTADIELVLAFGVHGPRELIVLVLS
ncbi:MAG: lactate utilization protein [Desulfobacterium sp.]|nr:lactate utilization protein [Desulfobacterium sp.]